MEGKQAQKLKLKLANWLHRKGCPTYKLKKKSIQHKVGEITLLSFYK